MSKLLEEAIIDAEKLRNAALENARNLILEEYAADIKSAVKTILEGYPNPSGIIENEEEHYSEPDIRPDPMNDMQEDTLLDPHAEEDEDIVLDFDTLKDAIDAELSLSDELDIPPEESIEDDLLDRDESLISEDGSSMASGIVEGCPAAVPGAKREKIIREFVNLRQDGWEEEYQNLGSSCPNPQTSTPSSSAEVPGEKERLNPHSLQRDEVEPFERLEEYKDPSEDSDWRTLYSDDDEIEEIDESLIRTCIEEELKDLNVDYEIAPSGRVVGADRTEKSVTEDSMKELLASKDEEFNTLRHDLQKEIETLKENFEKKVSENKRLLFNTRTLAEKLEKANLASGKLLYVNRVLKNPSLNERQKVILAESIEKTVSLEQAKAAFEMTKAMQDSSRTSQKEGKERLQEARGMANRTFVVSPGKDEEIDSTYSRMRELAFGRQR
jgi:hypothetical protein